MNRKVLVVLTTIVVGLAAAERSAREIADHLRNALGGQALDASGYLGFTFAVTEDGKDRASYRHAWDRRSGDYKVEGATRDGRVAVLFNIHSRKGRAWVDGKEVSDEALEKWLEFGYGRFINDTYWLLVPFKLQDPGVKLENQGATQENGKSFDRLGLSFDAGIGLTPGDKYTLWIDRATSRVDRWEMVLEGNEPPPVRSDWRDWVERGGVWFSTRKTMGNRAIELRDIEVAPSADPARFSPPAGS
jgi:hypothetical protein